MALSVEDYIRIAEIQNRPKSLQELIIPEAVRFGSQALGAGIGHLFGGGGRADDEEQKNLASCLRDANGTHKTIRLDLPINMMRVSGR